MWTEPTREAMVDVLERFKENTLAAGEPLEDEETLASARAEIERMVGADTTIHSFFPAFESEEFRAVVGVALTSKQFVVKTDGVTAFDWERVRNIKRWTGEIQPGGEKAERIADAKANMKRGLRYPFYTIPFLLAVSAVRIQSVQTVAALAAMLVGFYGIAFSAKSVVDYFRARRMDPPDTVTYAALRVELADTEITSEAKMEGFDTRTKVSEQNRRLQFHGYPEEIPENVQRLSADRKLK